MMIIRFSHMILQSMMALYVHLSYNGMIYMLYVTYNATMKLTNVRGKKYHEKKEGRSLLCKMLSEYLIKILPL